jgi:glutamate N-acetyltransferase / amino-acid N-acetyltransferase
MNVNVSPLAPKKFAEAPAIAGVRLGAIEAGIRYKGRKDLAVILFDKPAQVAGVFTKSKCPSAPVEWCRKHLKGGKARSAVVNSGNANAFTGKKGKESVRISAQAAAQAFGCRKGEVFLASTGVIGEPLDASGFGEHLTRLGGLTSEAGWTDFARAIMTTDTYPKLVTRTFDAEGRSFVITGVAKGAGMIAPDMATMLSFIVTDLPVASALLQKMLQREVRDTFNAITIDSDTSTSDTVLLFSAANGARPLSDGKDRRVRALRKVLGEVLHELAMMVVRDGEGATKHVQINIAGAHSAKSAKKIALSVANSPLVKTAIAGEDANWGRIVMAVGKAGEPANRDKLSIWFGDVRVARDGERDPDYDEATVSAIMRNDFIPVTIDVGVGKADATVWTCDLTKEYVAINGDYRS